MKVLYALVACMLTVTVAFGQNVKEKKFSGRFAASRGKLMIDNRYGKVDINTWDRNEVTVDITVTAKAKSMGRVQELLDRVSISEPGNGSNGINYKTIIGKGQTVNNLNGEFSVDYVINMPRKHTAEFINKFGDMDIEDVEGKLKINLEYGNLKTATVRGSDPDIHVKFGSATIASMESGSIDIGYSKLSIERAGSIKVSNEFGKTTIGIIRDLDITQRYGDLKIGTVNRLKGSVEFAGLDVDKLLKSVQMTMDHGSGARFDYVGPDVDNINVKTSFSNQYYHFDKAASLSADITTSFGKVNNDAGNVSLTESKPDRHGGIYKGKVGSGRGNMDLSASYGNIVFR